MTRHDLLEEAIERCYAEMYLKAIPPTNFREAIENWKHEDPETKKEYPFYTRYYLNQEDYTDIVENYINIYKINNPFKNNIEILEYYLKQGGSRDIYVEESEEGPAHREYAIVLPIKKQIDELIRNYIEDEESAENLRDSIVDKVFKTIGYCKEFFDTHREECTFTFSVMDSSPTTNPETVKQYWKEVHNKDIEIDTRPFEERCIISDEEEE